MKYKKLWQKRNYNSDKTDNPDYVMMSDKLFYCPEPKSMVFGILSGSPSPERQVVISEHGTELFLDVVCLVDMKTLVEFMADVHIYDYKKMQEKNND